MRSWFSGLVRSDRLNAVPILAAVWRRRLSLKIAVPPFGLDSEIVPLLNAAWAAGLPTITSCAGHAPSRWRDLRRSLDFGRWLPEHATTAPEVAIDVSAAQLDLLASISDQLTADGLPTELELLIEPLAVPRYAGDGGRLCVQLSYQSSIPTPESNAQWRARLTDELVRERDELTTAGARSGDVDHGARALRALLQGLPREAGARTYGYGLSVIRRAACWEVAFRRDEIDSAVADALWEDFWRSPEQRLDLLRERYIDLDDQFELTFSDPSLRVALGRLRAELGSLFVARGDDTDSSAIPTAPAAPGGTPGSPSHAA